MKYKRTLSSVQKKLNPKNIPQQQLPPEFNPHLFQTKSTKTIKYILLAIPIRGWRISSFSDNSHLAFRSSTTNIICKLSAALLPAFALKLMHRRKSPLLDNLIPIHQQIVASAQEPILFPRKKSRMHRN